jgi:DNA-binding transcriptional regulator GbsR (MarR family)
MKNKLQTPSDELLEQLKQILFPPLKLQTANKDGKIIKYHIDYSVDSNLDAVLMDLQEGYNDQTAQKTINGVVNRLNKARKLLEAYAELDKDAEYIIVEDLEDNINAENISE